MRKFISYLQISCLLVPIAITLLSMDFAPVTHKLALIIAIGNYDTKSTGWAQISSENDVGIVQEALTKIGFEPGSITVIDDAKADKKGILAALDALESKAVAGDIIVIHVSSHGQQIADDNNDEVDGLDEAIVAYGAPVSDTKYRQTRGSKVPYDGSLHLRDEEFGAAIAKIRAKVGKTGHVLVIVDSCHSGTVTRGSAKVRGGVEPLVPEGWQAPANKKEDDDGGFGLMSEKAKSRGAESEMGKFILISGASAEELNYETEDENNKGYGSLSYCFSKSIVSLPAGATYRQLFSKIQSEMAERAPKQSPQLEGDIDYVVFSGSYKKQEKYFGITQLISSKQIKINGGKLMGLSPGALVSIEKNGASAASKDGQSLAKGKVSSATAVDAVVDLETPLNIKNKVEAWVFVTSPAIPEVKIRVSVASLKNTTLKTAITKSIQEMGMAEVSENKPDLTLTEAPSRAAEVNVDIINTAFGTKLIENPVTGADIPKVVEGITNTVQNYAQGKMFKALDLQDPNYQVQITRIIPVKAGSKNIADTLSLADFVDKGNLVNIPEGTYIFLEVENKSDKIAYYNIVDLQPDGKINPSMPYVNKEGTVVPSPQELVLRPMQKKKLTSWPIRITKPFGNEILKVIATGVPFDLASTINTKGAIVGTRGSSNPMEKLLGKSFDKNFGTRGTETEIIPEDMGTNTAEFTFQIVTKQ